MAKKQQEFDDLISSYLEKGNDFGFSAVEDIPIEKELTQTKNVVSDQNQQLQEIRERFEKIEQLIMPFLANMLNTADQPYIHWPNRKPQLEKIIKEFLALTRN